VSGSGARIARHPSAAHYQGAKLIDHPFLLLRVIVGEVVLQFLEEDALSVCLALNAQANERSDGLLMLVSVVAAYRST